MNRVNAGSSLPEYVLFGGLAGVGVYILFHILTGSVPGIGGMIPWGLAGAVLAAMLFIFSSGIGKPV